MPESTELANLICSGGFALDISTKANELRKKRTPVKEIHFRQGFDGKTFKYVRWSAVAKWLDMHFPGWSWEVDPSSFKEYGEHVNCLGNLIVYDSGFPRKISGVGCIQIKRSKETKEPVIGMYYKAAETDAFKRAAVKLGAFMDIYTEEEEKENEEDAMLPAFLDVIEYVVKMINNSQANMTYASLFKIIMFYQTGQMSLKQIMATLSSKSEETKKYMQEIRERFNV